MSEWVGRGVQLGRLSAMRLTVTHGERRPLSCPQSLAAVAVFFLVVDLQLTITALSSRGPARNACSLHAHNYAQRHVHSPSIFPGVFLVRVSIVHFLSFPGIGVTNLSNFNLRKLKVRARVAQCSGRVRIATGCIHSYQGRVYDKSVRMEAAPRAWGGVWGNVLI